MCVVGDSLKDRSIRPNVPGRVVLQRAAEILLSLFADSLSLLCLDDQLCQTETWRRSVKCVPPGEKIGVKC